jgi:hypothetical protein
VDLKEALDQLLYVTKLMFDRLTLGSSNSSIPPSSDPNRKKDSAGSRYFCESLFHSGIP